LPSTRAIPDRDVFYVADLIRLHSRSVATGSSARVATGKDVVVQAPTGSGKTYINLHQRRVTSDE
jgi:hypothetical protein